MKNPKTGIIIPLMGAFLTGLGEALFTKTQRRVLAILFGNPDQSFYANEIVRLARTGTGTVHRELERLESARLVTAKKVGNQKHFRANKDAPIFEELHGIVLKTFGIADPLKAALQATADRVLVAFVFGSVAQSTDTASSDIDLMIISDDVSYSEILAALADVAQRLQRPINPVIYGVNEFKKMLSGDLGFVQGVVEKPKIFLIGSEDDLPKP